MAYRLSFEARQDLRDIGLYVGSVWGVSTRRGVLARIMHSIETLGSYPALGRVRDHNLGPGRRSLPSGQYIIIYTLNGSVARILRVINGRRDYAAIIRNSP